MTGEILAAVAVNNISFNKTIVSFREITPRGFLPWNWRGSCWPLKTEKHLLLLMKQKMQMED
ncbi:MAG TPA: hypothetical protein VGI03_04930 [Verrucomicrobiae bacterium]